MPENASDETEIRIIYLDSIQDNLNTILLFQKFFYLYLQCPESIFNSNLSNEKLQNSLINSFEKSKNIINLSPIVSHILNLNIIFYF